MRTRPTQRPSRGAPLWIYLALIVPANLAKEQLLPADAAAPLRAILTAAVVLGGIALVSTIYRAAQRGAVD